MESKSAEVNGIRMRWEEQGEGEPVVLVHGIPTSPRLWRHVMPRLRGARALAWEMVGYGASIPEGRGRDISVARQAQYLAAWMRTIGLDRAVLVGHDLGGGVAQIVAVQHRELVRGLVLMNAIAYDSWPIPSVKAMQVLGPLVARLPKGVFRLVLQLFIVQGHDNPACAREAMAAHWPYYAAADGAAAFIRQVRSLDVRDTLAIADRLPHLDVPARLVWGAADRFQQIGYGYRLAYELGARLDRIEGGKHFVPEDHAERVAATVNDLLAHIASMPPAP
jgi:pimeloyl-ACP methyl ester carboxylesterase